MTRGNARRNFGRPDERKRSGRREGLRCDGVVFALSWPFLPA
jgi:hypothetical protein